MNPDLYAFARAIMAAHGVSCSAAEFHHAINTVFHDMEAPVYDRLHQRLWENLPRYIGVLAEDILACSDPPAFGLRLLDVGCGTGIATESLLRSDLGRLITAIDGLDTSAAMLQKYEERAKNWPIRPQIREGQLQDLPADSQYDLIVASSVLHHIPDLSGFLAALHQRQAPGGFFIHVQDPNGDYRDDAELLERERQFEMADRKRRPSGPTSAARRIGHRLRRALIGPSPEESYLERTNRMLLERGTISTPLSAQEMWAITDVHIYNQEGISIEQMKRALDGYELVQCRSYAFFGRLWSEISEDSQRDTEDLMVRNAPNGRNVSACWRSLGHRKLAAARRIREN
jgi:2-polyprenyl-3-methyl-5-hydroxy-6-metoxy-1,4-benzoquinol methylase